MYVALIGLIHSCVGEELQLAGLVVVELGQRVDADAPAWPPR